MTGIEWLDVVTRILAGAGALGGAATIAALAKIGVDRRKGRAEAGKVEVDTGKVLTDAAVGLLEPLRSQISYLTDELRRSRDEAARDRAESELLRAEVHSLREYIHDLVDALRAAQAPVPPVPAPRHLYDRPAQG